MRRLFFLLPLLAAACTDVAAPPASVPAPTPLSAAFDATSTGTIAGRVAWDGPIPDAPPFRSTPEPLTDGVPAPSRLWANPNAVRPDSGGLPGCVVVLKGVDPAKSKPWDLAPVRVEAIDHRYRVHQGDRETSIGVVRRGEAVAFVSRQDVRHVTQVRGAAFFSLTLPEVGTPRERRLTDEGVAEVRSGAGFFWMRAHLYASDHPYVAVTGPDGRFALDGVPPGEYELTAWHPSPRVRDTERHQEFYRVVQVTFAPGYRATAKVVVTSRETATPELAMRP